jgi:hypothetical protein
MHAYFCFPLTPSPYQSNQTDDHLSIANPAPNHSNPTSRAYKSDHFEHFIIKRNKIPSKKLYFAGKRRINQLAKMEMKKIAFAALMVAASATAVVASEEAHASDAVAAAPAAALAAVSFLAYFLY